MGYIKTNWINQIKDAFGNIIQTGTKTNATNMNKIEQGIYDAHNDLTSHMADVAHVAGKIYAYKNLGGAL